MFKLHMTAERLVCVTRYSKRQDGINRHSFNPVLSFTQPDKSIQWLSLWRRRLKSWFSSAILDDDQSSTSLDVLGAVDVQARSSHHPSRTDTPGEKETELILRGITRYKLSPLARRVSLSEGPPRASTPLGGTPPFAGPSHPITVVASRGCSACLYWSVLLYED
jgi:hypothetical protein